MRHSFRIITFAASTSSKTIVEDTATAEAADCLADD